MLQIILLLLGIVLVIVATIALYKWGRKTIDKQDEQRNILSESKQYTSMLIIDKKHLRLKNSGLPQVVLDQAHWYQKNTYVPVIKAKVGPQIAVFTCDRELFDMIPVKKEVRAAISGVYILEVKALHGKLPKPEPKKKSGFKRFVEKIQEKAGAKPL